MRRKSLAATVIAWMCLLGCIKKQPVRPENRVSEKRSTLAMTGLANTQHPEGHLAAAEKSQPRAGSDERPTSDPSNAKPADKPTEGRIAPDFDPAPGPTVTLKNGASLLFLKDPLPQTCAVQLFVRGGLGAETAGPAGVSHLLERLLLHEIGRAAREKIRKQGGQVVAYTSLDYTVFELTLPKAQQTGALDFLGAILWQNPRFEDAMLSRQIEQIEQERLRAPLGSPAFALESLRKLLFADHPYGQPLLGDPGRLRTLLPDHMARFYAQRFAPKELILVAAGPISTELSTSLTELLEKRPAVSAEPVPPTAPASLAKTTVRVQSHALPGSAVLAAAWPGKPAHSEQAVALQIWAQILRNRLHGKRYFQDEIAEQFSGRQAGFLFVYTQIKPADLEEASQHLRAELVSLSHTEISRAELERAKRQLLVQHAAAENTPSGRAHAAGQGLSLGIAQRQYAQALRHLDETAVAQTVLSHSAQCQPAVLWLLPSTGNARKDEAMVSAGELVLRSVFAPPALPQLEQTAHGVWKVKMPGGPLVLVWPETSVPMVAVAATWPGGLASEDERRVGGHALFSQLWADCRGPGSFSLNAQIDQDTLSLVSEWPRPAHDEAFAAFLSCLGPRRPKDWDFEQKRRQFSHELALQDESQRLGLARLKAQLFPDHPYRLEPSPQTVLGLAPDKLWDAFRRVYAKNQLTLAVVGDVDPQKVLAVLAAHFPSELPGATPGLTNKPRPLQPIAPSPQNIAHHGRTDAWLGVGFRTPGLQSNQQFALHVLSELLLGPGGRLVSELVDKRGLFLRLDGRLELGLHGGALWFAGFTLPHRLEAAKAALLQILRHLKEEALLAEEFAAARARVLSRWMLQRQRRQDAALALARRTALALPFFDEEQQMAALSWAEVQAVWQQVFREDQTVVQAVVPQTRFAVRRGDTLQPQKRLSAALGKGPARKSAGQKRSSR